MQGFNSRLDEIQAAILTERLRYLDAFTERRQQIASFYFDHIKTSKVKTLRRSTANEHHVYHLFVLNATDRNAVMANLKAHEIESLIHYPVPIHSQESCLELKRDPKGLAVAESHARTCFSIPCHPGLTDAELAKICHALNSI